MADKKIRKLKKGFTVEAYRESYFDRLKSTLEYMLRELPGAQYIELTAIEYYDEEEKENESSGGTARRAVG